MILRNGVTARSIPSQSGFTSSVTTCWNDFNFKNDIVELRHNGGGDGVSIHVNLIKEGVSTKLLFGSNANIDWVILDNGPITSGTDGLFCIAAREAAYAVKIRKGNIIQSQCIKP